MSGGDRIRRRGPMGPRVDGDGVFTGYASVFGVVDLSGDLVLPGAFAASLERRGPAGVKLLYQHDPTAPIGRWLGIEEDRRGLKVTGQLQPEVVKGREAISLLRAGILDGLSIGFRAIRARTDPASGVRRLAEIDLWEISIVTFPMQPGARIAPAATPAAPARTGTGDLAGALRQAAVELNA